MDMKKHHDLGNSYEGKLYVGVACLLFRVSVYYHLGGTRQNAGSHSAGEEADICLTGRDLSVYETSKPPQ